MQDFSGGGGQHYFFLILDIHAAKLRAAARGLWGHAPPINFFKLCIFVRFEGYFQPQISLKKLKINRNFFTDPFIMLLPH